MTWLTRCQVWLRRLHQRIHLAMPRWSGPPPSHTGIADGIPRRRERTQPNVAVGDGVQVEDTKLLQLIALGNQQALRTLYDRYSRRVFSLALHITGDRQHAEVVTEDVFVLVWHHHDIGQSRLGTVQNWIAAITRTRALDTLRSQPDATCHRAVSTPTEELVAINVRDPLEPQAELRDTWCRAFDTLPPDQRQVLERTYYGGRTITEVAADLAVPVGTMQARVRHALLTLRTALTHAADMPRTHDDHAGAADRAVGE